MGKKLTDAQKAKRQQQIQETQKLYAEVIEIAQIVSKATFFAEWRFCPERKFTFDYYSPKINLAIEFEGGNGYGGHAQFNRYTTDVEKYNLATAMGYRVIRLTKTEIDKNTIFQYIRLMQAHDKQKEEENEK